MEDNSDDELLILRSLKTANLENEIVVARDGPKRLIISSPPAHTPIVPRSNCQSSFCWI